MDYILGLDLGPTSIGWAVIECTPEGAPMRLVDANSRIFLSMVEADTKVPKNKKRREKRAMRRQLRRYKERREELVRLMHAHGLLPADIPGTRDWERQLNQLGHPIQLRAEALSRQLSLPELGRVFLHLLRRRGYKSNRGAKFQTLMEEVKKRELNLAFNDMETAESDVDEAGDDSTKETGKVLTGIRLMDSTRPKFPAALCL